jgi:integrase
MDKARSGVHPVEARKQKQLAEQKAATEQAYTLDKLIEQFIKKHHRNSRPSTIYECRRLGKRALPFIGGKPVKQITKADILAMINDLADTRVNKWRGEDKSPALSEASGVLRHLRTAFRWAVDHDLIERDPTQGVRDPMGGKRERERVLSESEIIALWRVCDEIGYPYGPIVQLLILTGQREREIGDMSWHELGDLEKRILSLPSTRTKNHRAHDVHLFDLALEIIGRVPKFTDGAGFLFSVDGTKPVESYADAKEKIDRRMTELLGDVEPWVFHDLSSHAP